MRKITNRKVQDDKHANLDFYCAKCGQAVKKEDIATHKCKEGA